MNIKNIRQLLCRHLWKEEQKVRLREGTEENGFNPLKPYRYLYYAVYQKCLKCDKKKITQEKVMIG